MNDFAQIIWTTSYEVLSLGAQGPKLIWHSSRIVLLWLPLKGFDILEKCPWGEGQGPAKNNEALLEDSVMLDFLLDHIRIFESVGTWEQSYKT